MKEQKPPRDNTNVISSFKCLIMLLSTENLTLTCSRIVIADTNYRDNRTYYISIWTRMERIYATRNLYLYEYKLWKELFQRDICVLANTRSVFTKTYILFSVCMHCCKCKILSFCKFLKITFSKRQMHSWVLKIVKRKGHTNMVNCIELLV